jgi:hypothetical protein
LFDRRCIQIALAGDPGVAAFLTLGRFFQDDDLGSQIVRSDSRSYARCPEPYDDDVCCYVPFIWR